MPKPLTFVLGGARSGKSRFAQQLAATSGEQVVYVATAEATDVEMAGRIERHRQARPAGWRTVELARHLDERIGATVGDRETVLVDCLSVWLSNELLAAEVVPEPSPQGGAATVEAGLADVVEARLLGAVDRLVAWAGGRAGATIVVSNEIGAGVVPAYPLGRLYRDLLGLANQRLAAAAGATYLVVAGIGVDLRRLQAALGGAQEYPGPPPH